MTSQGRELAWACNFTFLCDVFDVRGESEAFVNYDTRTLFVLTFVKVLIFVQFHFHVECRYSQQMFFSLYLHFVSYDL